MKKYFLSSQYGSLGPYSIEELKQKKFTNKTLVWSKDLPDWVKAETILELKDVFEIIPPLNPKHKARLKESKALKSGINNALLVWIVSSILFFLLAGGFASDAHLENRYSDSGIYTETTMELRMIAILPGAVSLGTILALGTLFFVYRFHMVEIIKIRATER